MVLSDLVRSVSNVRGFSIHTCQGWTRLYSEVCIVVHEGFTRAERDAAEELCRTHGVSPALARRTVQLYGPVDSKYRREYMEEADTRSYVDEL